MSRGPPRDGLDEEKVKELFEDISWDESVDDLVEEAQGIKETFRDGIEIEGGGPLDGDRVHQINLDLTDVEVINLYVHLMLSETAASIEGDIVSSLVITRTIDEIMLQTEELMKPIVDSDDKNLVGAFNDITNLNTGIQEMIDEEKGVGRGFY